MYEVLKLVNYTKVEKEQRKPHFQDTIKVSREHLNQGQKDRYRCCLQCSPCHQRRTPCGSLLREIYCNIVHFVFFCSFKVTLKIAFIRKNGAGSPERYF